MKKKKDSSKILGIIFMIVGGAFFILSVGVFGLQQTAFSATDVIEKIVDKFPTATFVRIIVGILMFVLGFVIYHGKEVLKIIMKAKK
jgi:uncharacterized BrkB/YihY/UPF0761 family membrane protein